MKSVGVPSAAERANDGSRSLTRRRMMRRAVVPLLGLGCLLALMLFCYRAVHFEDAPFASANASSIFRANRMMRAAAVPAGEHTLVDTYDPLSFRIGAIISLAGPIVLLTFAWSSHSRTSRTRSATTSDPV
jgi:hypothetical protein